VLSRARAEVAIAFGFDAAVDAGLPILRTDPEGAATISPAAASSMADIQSAGKNAFGEAVFDTTYPPRATKYENEVR
jgi:hypothetical protein